MKTNCYFSNKYCYVLFCSEAPEATAALITHAAVEQIIKKDLSIYKQDELDNACE